MNRKERSFLANYILVFTMLIYFLRLMSNSNNLNVEIKVAFFANFILIMYGVTTAKKDISLYKSSLYFFLLFLVIAPLNQLISGYAPWRERIIDSEIFRANIIIFIYNFTFILSYKQKYRLTVINKKYEEKLTEIPTSILFYKILFFISTISFFIGVIIIGFNNLFIRGEAVITGTTFSIMVDFLIRSIPVLSLSIFLYSKKALVSYSKSIGFNTMVLLLLCYSILLNFPTSLSRFLVGTVYLGLIVSFLPKKFWKYKKFDILFLIVILIFFPLFYFFKNYTLSQLFTGEIKLNIRSFESVDFDAFTLIGRTIRFVEEQGLQLGNQIRSTIFFFIPQDFLDLKGIPSGELVAKTQGFFYTNLSEPIMAEAYIDFGYIGVVLYGIVIGAILAKIDALEEIASNLKGKVYYVQPVSAFLLGFIIYLNRGALQPTFLRLMGFFLFLVIIYFIFRLKKAKKLI